MRTIEELGEFRLIDRVTRHLPTAPFVVEGVGDDCGVVRIGNRLLLVTSDMFMEDVHFRPANMAFEDIGWKATAAAMSDIAAMGGAPLFCILSVAYPTKMAVNEVEKMYAGVMNVLSRYGAVLLGGDTTSSRSGLAIDVAAVGQAVGNHYLRRKGARSGDLLAVTGTLGRAAAGFHALENGRSAPELELAHTRPRPRIPEGQWLATQGNVRAMIDVSDGLVSDAGHLAEASGLGVNIETQRLPVDEELTAYCDAAKVDATRMMLGGGEDYELAFAVNPPQSERLIEDFDHEFRTGITIVGSFSNAWSGVRVDGEEVDYRGFEHFA